MACERQHQATFKDPTWDVTDAGCKGACTDVVFDKNGKKVTVTCLDVTIAGFASGALVTGDQKCVCTVPCGDGCTYTVTKFDAGKGTPQEIQCKGDCPEYFQKDDGTGSFKPKCKLVLDHADRKLKCVCIVSGL